MVQTFSKNEYWLIVEALQQARDSITEQEQSETWDEKTDEEKCELQDRNKLLNLREFGLKKSDSLKKSNGHS